MDSRPITSASSQHHDVIEVIPWESGDVGVDVLGMTQAESQLNEELRRSWRREPQLMRLLSEYNVKRIRGLFDLKGGSDGLSMSEFLYVLDRCLGMWIINKTDFFCQMIDMFRQVDVNGDESMEWEEFSTYLISMGVQTKNDPRFFSTNFMYTYTDGLDRTTHLTPITRLQSFQDSAVNRPVLCAIERGSQMVRVWKPVEKMNRLRLCAGRTFRHDTAFHPHAVLAALYIPELDMLATTSTLKGTTFYITFFNAATSAQLHRLVTPNALSSLAWSAAMFLVCAAGQDGRAIRCYCPRNFVCKQQLPIRMGAVSSMVSAPGHLIALLLVGNTDGSLTVWDLKTNRELLDREVFAHELGVAQVRISKPLDMVLSASLPLKGQRIAPKRLNAILVWPFSGWLGDVETGSRALEYLEQQRREQAGQPGAARCADASAKAPKAADRGGENSVGPLNKLLVPRRLLGHEFPVADVQVADSPLVMVPHIVSLDRGGNMRVWHGRTLECLQVASVFQLKLINSKKASAFAAAQLKAKRAQQAARYNERLIAGEVGADVEAWAVSEPAVRRRAGSRAAGSEHGSATEPESEGDELDLDSVPLRPLPAHAAWVHDSVLSGSAAQLAEAPPDHKRGLLLLGKRISYASARVRLYPDKGEGRAERLYEAGLGDGNKEARVLGVASTKLSADLDDDDRAAGKLAVTSIAAAVPGGPSSSKAKRQTVSEYALTLRKLDKFAHCKSELLSTRRTHTAHLHASSELSSMFGSAVTELDESEAGSSSASSQVHDEDSEDSEDPGADKAKLCEAHSLLVLPPEAGGSELHPMLAVGGDKLRLMAFTQHVPDLLPLVAALFVEPTLTVCTISARNIIIWDILVGRPICIHSVDDIADNADVTAACLDARHRKLYIGDSLGRIRCLNYGALMLTASAELKQLDPHQFGTAVVHLEFVPGMNQVLSLGADGQVQMCDDHSIAGYNRHTLDSVLKVRLPIPDPADIGALGLPATWDPSQQKHRVQRKTSVREMVARGSVLAEAEESDEEHLQVSDEDGTGPALHMLGNSVPPILRSKVEVPAAAASSTLGLLATASRGTNGTWWVIIWSLRSGRAEGVLVSPDHAAAPLDAVVQMQFLEPWPLLLVLTVSGSVTLWDVPPSPHAFLPRIQFAHPENAALSTFAAVPADSLPPVRHGSLGGNLGEELRGGFAVFGGDYDGRIHRWRIPGAALAGCNAVAAGEMDRVKETRIATKRMSLSRLQRLFRFTLRQVADAGPLPLLGETFPGGPACHRGVLWELSWNAHAGSVVSLKVLAADNSVLSASSTGLARVWDNEGRLLGTLDTTPRYTAPVPTWAAPTDDQPHQEDLFSKLGKEADGMSCPTGFSRPDEQHEQAFGVGTGSGHPDDRTSMIHVCTRRVYAPHQLHKYLAELRKASKPGQPVNLLAHTCPFGDDVAAEAKGLPSTERTVTARLSGSTAMPPGLLWNGEAPIQGPVLWHFRTHLVARNTKYQYEALQFRAIIVLMRALEKGEITLQRFRRRTQVFSDRAPVILPPAVVGPTDPSEAEAKLREALENQEDLAEYSKPDPLRHTIKALQAPERRARTVLLPGVTLSPLRAQKQPARLSERAAKLAVSSHLSMAARHLPEDKWDKILASMPDYSDPVFAAGIRRAAAVSLSAPEPAYFSDYSKLAAWAPKSAISKQALPATLLSIRERQRVQTGQLFSGSVEHATAALSPFSYRRGHPAPLPKALKKLIADKASSAKR